MAGGKTRAALAAVLCLTVAAAGCGQPARSGRRRSPATRVSVEVAGPSSSATPTARPAPRARAADAPAPLLLRRAASTNAPLRAGYIGDSVAFSLVPTMRSSARELISRYHLPLDAEHIAGFVGPGFGLTADVPGRNDVGPTPPAASFAHWRDGVARIVRDENPDFVVVVLGVWDTIERDPGGRALRPGMAAWRAWYLGIADRFVRTLTSRGTDLIWVVMPCVGRPDVNRRLGMVNAVLRQTATVAPGRVAFVPLSKVACRAGRPIYRARGPWGPITLRQADGVHFRPFEAPVVLRPFVVREFAALFRRALPAPPVVRRSSFAL
jgi:hypothetical protein